MVYPNPVNLLSQVTHIYLDKLNIIGSDIGSSPGGHQAIIWTIAGILLIRTLGIDFSEIQSEIHIYSFNKMHLKMPSAKWRKFFSDLNILNNIRYWPFRCTVKCIAGYNDIMVVN